MAESVEERITEGRRALRAADAPRARAVFEAALAEAPSGEALEGLAEVAYLELDYAQAAELYERAYTAYRQRADHLAAGRAARAAAWIHGGVLGEWAVESGWLSRARTILEEAGKDRPEWAWVLIIQHMSEPDPLKREELLREAMAIGQRFGDPDVEFEARGYLAGLYVLIGRVDEGLALFDEVLAAVCAGEVRDIAVVDGVFCGFFWMCERVNDVVRADQWVRNAREVLERRNVPAAFCRAHYGSVLTAAGRWSEAEAQFSEAVRHFEHVSARRAAVLVRLADLRVRQGRLEEAAQLLEGLDQHPDAVGPLAALHLARVETAVARTLLERTTACADDEETPAVGESSVGGPLLALLVDVYLAEGQTEQATQAAERLARIAEQDRSDYLQASAALARGRVCLATGAEDARSCLERALAGFAQAQLPFELSRVRLELARALSSDRPEVAITEAKAALDGFERLAAARHADAAAALLRSLGAPARTGPKGREALTKREAEVLELLGHGLSNPEISDRLYISRKTVEHHVARVLSKLGLRSRAEAAAYAARTGPRRP